MFSNDLKHTYQTEKTMPSGKESSAGKSLKKIFRQDDTLNKIENQPATISMLMNPVRLAIFLHLCQNPCDHTRSMARKMEVNLTLINWHLRQLFQKGFIESANINGKRAYWPSGMILHDDALIVMTLRNEWALKIIKAILEINGEARQKNIVNRMGVSQQQINVWLEKMISAGLLEKVSHRMNARYRIAPSISSRTAQYDEASKRFSALILDLLGKDGLMPKKPKLRGSRLFIMVKLPSGNRRLRVECNPLAPLKLILKGKKS